MKLLNYLSAKLSKSYESLMKVLWKSYESLMKALWKSCQSLVKVLSKSCQSFIKVLSKSYQSLIKPVPRVVPLWSRLFVRTVTLLLLHFFYYFHQCLFKKWTQKILSSDLENASMLYVDVRPTCVRDQRRRLVRVSGSWQRRDRRGGPEDAADVDVLRTRPRPQSRRTQVLWAAGGARQLPRQRWAGGGDGRRGEEGGGGRRVLLCHRLACWPSQASIIQQTCKSASLSGTFHCSRDGNKKQ